VHPHVFPTLMMPGAAKDRRGVLKHPVFRVLLLVLAAVLSLPAQFMVSPGMGLDPSWKMALQLASINKMVFGRDFIFTYGPLGDLLIHAATFKAAQLGYDLFVLLSLVGLYRVVLPDRPRVVDGLLLLALALVTKTCLLAWPATVLFNLLGFWLWRTAGTGNFWPAGLALGTAFLLFFGKVNYGLVVVVFVPAYGLGLAWLEPRKRAVGISLLAGLPLVIAAGCLGLGVNGREYLRAAWELIAGYNEAMFMQVASGQGLALGFVLAIVAVAYAGRSRTDGKFQVLLLPVLLLATYLLCKNAFVRADAAHAGSFFFGLPLLLAAWVVCWPGARPVRILLLASLVYPLAEYPRYNDCGVQSILPGRYISEVVSSPWHLDADFLRDRLNESCPEARLPREAAAAIGQATVDVMPWDVSLVIRNGLNYHPRPIPQSYCAYTPWLDHCNASFLAGTNAPEYLLYVCAKTRTIDFRPAAWDEAMTKRALLENYRLEADFNVLPPTGLGQTGPSTVFVLQHSPRCCRLLPVATNTVDLALNQPLRIPATTNLVVLTLAAQRSWFGTLKSTLWKPSELEVEFHYANGFWSERRAVLPLLGSGVLVNRRIESAEEVRNWLQLRLEQNLNVATIQFTADHPGDFAAAFHGALVEYQIVQ